jgi:hypothetical protein
MQNKGSPFTVKDTIYSYKNVKKSEVDVLPHKSSFTGFIKSTHKTLDFNPIVPVIIGANTLPPKDKKTTKKLSLDMNKITETYSN